MQYLKQSTAATLKIGPFLDDTDGKTAETTLTIAQADVRLSKNGGNIAQKTEATSCTHDELGVYGCPIDATDTATLGRLQLWVHETGALPVWHEYTVLPANVYDSLFSTDKLQVDLIQMGGVAQSATDLKDFADAGYDPGTNKIECCKVNDDMKGTDGANTTVPDAAGVAPTAAEIKTEIEQAGSSLAQILADTGTTIPADLLTMKQTTAGGYDRDTDSLEAIRNRGDSAWVTGGGGSLTEILNIQALIPNSIDLADTATVRLALGLTNMLDDLPTTTEITPGTITIDRKAIGETAWSTIVNAAACSEAAGLVYYDEVFNGTSGYEIGDSIRITFKSQKITVSANDFEITGTDGWIFQTYIREKMNTFVNRR